MILIDKIAITRSGRNLFEDFTFRLKEGDNVVVSGQNGSGKTTLLEILYGSLHPKAGRVKYDFIDENSGWDERYRKRNSAIHFVPAQALHDVLGNKPDLHYQQRYYNTESNEPDTVRDFLGALVSRLPGLDLPPALDISSLLDIPLTRLSNGQIRKIIIIRQLLRHIPQLILFDYPFEGLDRESRDSLNVFIDHLHSAFRIQFVLTGHNDNFPECMNRRIWLQDYKVIRDEKYSGIHEEQKAERIVANLTSQRSDQAVVEFRNVNIRYGSRELLAGFDWLVRRGDRWALTGKNGSGKTTIFSLIYADHPFAYSQSVFIFGRKRGSGESIWDIKKRISYLGPEQMHLIDSTSLLMAGRDYVLSRVGERHEGKLEEVAHYFGANNLLHAPLWMLSSGELQLLHLIALFVDPKELLLLDEPFQFLDPVRKHQVCEFLTDKLDGNSTLILITHDEDDVRQWTRQRLHLG